MAVVLTFEQKKIEGGLGHAMLLKMGWSKDTGLGRDRNGRVDPLPCVGNGGRQCLGAPPPKVSSCIKPKAEWFNEVEEITMTRVDDWEWREKSSRGLKNGKGPKAKKFCSEGAHNPHAPCCKFDSSHRVPLRLLKDHERRCPANPENRRKTI